MKLNDVSSVASFFFSKGTDLVKENPKSLIGITALGLLSVAYKNRGSNSFNIRFSTENLREITSQVVNHSYIKFLEVAVLLGNERAFLALNSINIDERAHALEDISDRVVSLVGLSQEGLENSPLGFMLENTDEDDTSITEYSLKDLCGKVVDIPNQQLPESIEIAERLIESLKDKEKVAELITFCSETPSRVQSLFSIVHYLGLDNHQDEHLEPFNKVFPGISLDEAPKTIRQLDLSGQNIESINFSGFIHLKILNLNGGKNLTAAKFNSIPASAKASIEILDLTRVDVKYFNFSEFINLKSLDLSIVQNLTDDQFNAIPTEAKASIEYIYLVGVNVTGFDFSGFINLKTLYLGNVQGLTVDQFNEISPQTKASLETLDLKLMYVTGFDFSGFTNLKSLDLSIVRNLTADQFNAIPTEAKASIGDLYLTCVNVTGFDFSGFINLKTLYLDNAKDLTDEQLNTIPNKASIELLKSFLI
jgi:hypothetical protein